MDRPKLGTGDRFRALTKSGKSPALAAFVGRRKHGKRRFQQLAAAGRRRAEKAGSSGY